MPKLQQVKLEDNRLTGAIPPEFASRADLACCGSRITTSRGRFPRRSAPATRCAASSVNFEDNPRMCGDVPEGLVVDWRWHLENQAGQSRDWLAFCEKDPCGVFAYGGTGIGRPCPSGEAAAATCKAWEQCGGTVALGSPETLIGPPTPPTTSSRTSRSMDPGVVAAGSTCEDVPREEPCASGGDECSFRRCVPSADNGARPAPATEIPADVLTAYRASNRATDPDVDSDVTPCALPWGQCGGTAGWIGPSCCSGTRLRSRE